MAQACDSECVRVAMGFQSENQYITDFGNGCLGKEQNIYCIGGVPSIAPRGCTKVFGEARHDNTGSNVPATQWPSSGNKFGSGIGSKVTLALTNNTCYAMNITYQMTSGTTFTLFEPAGGGVSQIHTGFAVTENGVAINGTGSYAQGGTDDQFAYNATPIRSAAGTNTLFRGSSLAPGASITVGLVAGMSTNTNPHPNSTLEWSAAVRVTGTTVCP